MLLILCYSSVQVWAVVKNRYKLFKVEVPKDLSDSVEKTLKAARVTQIERKLFVEGLLESIKPDKLEDAKGAINQQIRGFKVAEVASGDLHESLWLHCVKVTRGQSPKDVGIMAVLKSRTD